MEPVNALCFKYQIRKWQIEQGADFLARPIVADAAGKSSGAGFDVRTARDMRPFPSI